MERVQHNPRISKSMEEEKKLPSLSLADHHYKNNDYGPNFTQISRGG